MESWLYLFKEYNIYFNINIDTDENINFDAYCKKKMEITIRTF